MVCKIVSVPLHHPLRSGNKLIDVVQQAGVLVEEHQLIGIQGQQNAGNQFQAAQHGKKGMSDSVRSSGVENAPDDRDQKNARY